MHEKSHSNPSEEDSKTWNRLEHSEIPPNLKIEYSGEAPVIKSVMNLGSEDQPILIIAFQSGGIIAYKDSELSVKNLNASFRISVDGKVLAEASQNIQSGGGSQSIQASGGSSITGVRQNIQ